MNLPTFQESVLSQGRDNKEEIRNFLHSTWPVRLQDYAGQNRVNRHLISTPRMMITMLFRG
ncbi:hypothetical protein N7541_003734 [Penicillium brevicompactum]|uniref:Uncharacterized protein n=1 Tax=Penicillium brevicompactum TaxID=5074 RepID=A0A9W9V1D0_PENBR|nr:hypothetical protein N7452_001901 [Penicillium brevicompactum]KAJ5362890.1 hypothetical protein N7541_003734 [Penicillium brevicompactum]